MTTEMKEETEWSLETARHEMVSAMSALDEHVEHVESCWKGREEQLIKSIRDLMWVAALPDYQYLNDDKKRVHENAQAIIEVYDSGNPIKED